ncbi:MAG: hypothetical protein K6E42_03470 [Synergistes sp.]|nr:hypothetical protein [Synergistes sp.]
MLNLASKAAALPTFAASGNVLYSIAIPALLCRIAGCYAGAHMAFTRDSGFIRPMRIGVFIILMIKILLDLFA